MKVIFRKMHMTAIRSLLIHKMRRRELGELIEMRKLREGSIFGKNKMSCTLWIILYVIVQLF